MRMMIKFSIPVEFGNSAIRSGQLQKITQQLSEDLKPEAAYFTLSMASGAGFSLSICRSCRKLPK